MFFNTPDRLNYFPILQNHTSATIFQYSECGYPIPELPITIVQYLWAVPLRKCFSTLRAQNTCKTLAEATTIFQYLNLRNTCIILAEATSVFQYSDLAILIQHLQNCEPCAGQPNVPTVGLPRIACENTLGFTEVPKCVPQLMYFK